jgi:peptidyl-dipeptidase A
MHINDDPVQYYDYAIGTIIKFQLYDHIAREILHQDPHVLVWLKEENQGRKVGWA